MQIAEQESLAYVPPFDDERVWAGHAAMVPELMRQLPGPPDAIVVAVGGGGLLAGASHLAHRPGKLRTTIKSSFSTTASEIHAGIQICVCM